MGKVSTEHPVHADGGPFLWSASFSSAGKEGILKQTTISRFNGFPDRNPIKDGNRMLGFLPKDPSVLVFCFEANRFDDPHFTSYLQQSSMSA